MKKVTTKKLACIVTDADKEESRTARIDTWCIMSDYANLMHNIVCNLNRLDADIY